MIQRAEFLERVKQAVHAVEPDADIVLYGSRARGDAHWDCGEVLCSIMRSRQEWSSSLYQVTPFAQMLREQGIRM
jgi:hypothetical protein